jgi:GntR family transcriptional repressor for pyruvate dehydrogenase complex
MSRIGTSMTDPLIALPSARLEATDDYLEFRGMAESLAARLAAGRATDVDRANLTEVMARIDAAHGRIDASVVADADADPHLAVYEASHNLVLPRIVRARSGMPRTGVFYDSDRLCARPEVREILLDPHRAIHAAILARDPEAAGAAAAAHLGYTERVLHEIRAAESRLEISLRRIDGGNLSKRAQPREA